MTTDTGTTNDARTTITKLSEEFDRAVIRMKPGSAKRPAMPYVSHGSVTKRLNNVCPGWSSRVVETHSYLNGNGVLVCAAVLLELTIPGVGSRQEYGTANQPRNFGDDAKNAASDALKRCAMRFGVAIDLWESADEADEDAAGDPLSGVLDHLAGMDSRNEPYAEIKQYATERWSQWTPDQQQRVTAAMRAIQSRRQSAGINQ